MNIKSPQNTDIPALRKLWREAFGDTDEFLDVFFNSVFNVKRAMCVATGNEIVGALYWFNCEHREDCVAYIYAVATAKEYRGRGICHKLMEYTHTYLANLGYKGAVLVPGNRELFAFYGSMGYGLFGFVKEYKCTAGTETVKLTEIDEMEYAQLRREFLPEGGIVQENENIDFLSTYAKFYKGTDFILVGRKEGDFFQGIELLGNEKKSSEIIKTLGCREGMFRTVGECKAFAMYCPLSEEKIETPKYFGLPFD